MTGALSAGIDFNLEVLSAKSCLSRLGQTS